jgi:hypothetical protein
MKLLRSNNNKRNGRVELNQLDRSKIWDDERQNHTHKSTQRHIIFIDVLSHHQGVLLLVEVPTKGRVFLNPIPRCRSHRSRRSLTQFAHKEPAIHNVLGIIHKFGDSKGKITSTQGTTRSKSKEIASKNDLRQLEREIEGLSQKHALESRSYLTPKNLPIDQRGKDLGCEVGVEVPWNKGEQTWHGLGLRALGFRSGEEGFYSPHKSDLDDSRRLCKSRLNRP